MNAELCYNENTLLRLICKSAFADARQVQLEISVNFGENHQLCHLGFEV